MSFFTYDTADDIITSLEIIEKLLFPETDFWRNNYLKDSQGSTSTNVIAHSRQIEIKSVLYRVDDSSFESPSSINPK